MLLLRAGANSHRGQRPNDDEQKQRSDDCETLLIALRALHGTLTTGDSTKTREISAPLRGVGVDTVISKAMLDKQR